MSKEKILVVEDEDAILMLLEDDLTMEGYEVSTAQDGKRGLSMARDDDYDLVILDGHVAGEGRVRGLPRSPRIGCRCPDSDADGEESGGR